MVAAIADRVPELNVVRNQVPKSWVDYDFYVQLVPDENADNPFFPQVPRLAAFEVSYKGIVSSWLDLPDPVHIL